MNTSPINAFNRHCTWPPIYDDSIHFPITKGTPNWQSTLFSCRNPWFVRLLWHKYPLWPFSFSSPQLRLNYYHSTIVWCRENRFRQKWISHWIISSMIIRKELQSMFTIRRISVITNHHSVCIWRNFFR